MEGQRNSPLSRKKSPVFNYLLPTPDLYLKDSVNIETRNNPINKIDKSSKV